MTRQEEHSLIDRVRRTVVGPTDAERAARLRETATESPNAIDGNDIDELGRLCRHDDEAVVGDAIGAAEALARERPALVAELAPALVETLTNRPAETWTSTTLGGADRAFMNDLLAGSTLLELATDDPTHLSPVVDGLETLLQDTDGRLEPHSLFALAHVAADGEIDVDIDVPTTAFVDPISRTLRSSVESEDDEPYGDGLSITVAPRQTQVELLEAFGDPDALDTLQYVEATTDDDELAAAAAEAIQTIDA